MANLGVGRAWLALGRLMEARDQIGYCQSLAQTDEELAMVYYWHAQSIEAIGNPVAALPDWLALLKLPAGTFSAEWRQAAQERVQTITTSTPPIPPLLRRMDKA